jgi:hypothetical protein
MNEVTLEQVFLRFFYFSPANHHYIAPHSSITVPRGVDSPDQATHYHTLGTKLEASSLMWRLAGLGVKVVLV